MNPYETLGVEPDANDDQIRAAYRRGAQKKHPDKGGDAAEFRVLQEAFELLRDPARRARYDADSTTSKGDDPVVRARQDLCGIALQAVDRMAQHDDLIELMRRIISHSIAHFKGETIDRRRKALELERRSSRIVAKSGENFLARALSTKVEELRRGIAALEEDIKHGEQMLELLNDFEFVPDEQSSSAGNRSMYITWAWA